MIMLSLLSIIGVGFFLGMRHATDADHVVAVTTIVSREHSLRSAALIGAAWGLGHTLTVMIVGGAIILFGLVIPPRLGLGMELGVGLMLILLGIWNLQAFKRWLGPSGSRTDRGEHAHAHPPAGNPLRNGQGRKGRSPAPLESLFRKLPLYQSVRPFIVGVVHGLAGSAAVALLLLPMIHSPSWAVGYLTMFGLGTIAGMVLITVALAWPFSSTAVHSTRLHRHLGFASGCLSVGFGGFMIYQIAFVQGLLTR